MDCYYVLTHMIELESDLEEVKLIGVYSSEEKAEAARESVRNLPGFRDYPEDFYINPLDRNKSPWSGGFFIETFDDVEEEE